MNNLLFFRLVRIGSCQQCSSGKYTVWWSRCCNQRSISPVILASGKRERLLSTKSLVLSQDNNTIPSKQQQKQKRKRKTKKEKKPNLRLPNRAFVSCLPGLEKILSSELTALNIDHQSQVGGAALLKSPVSIVDIYRCHLFLGTATEIRLRCTEPFSARTFPELRRKVRTFISWKDLFDTKNENVISLLAKVSSNKSKLFHTSAIRERIIEEINNALRQNGDDDDDNDFIKGVTDLDSHSDDGTLVVKLDVRVTKDMFDVGICTSVVPLHRRGYRFETAKAPLREDIAYAMLWSSGWKPSYFIDGQDNKRDIFLDPFCGSGTIAIEAAAMANSLPPGRFLDPPLKGTMLYDEDKWLQTVQTGITADSKNKIVIPTVHASDRDKGAVKAAKRNAERAGVLDIMDIRHCAIASQPLWEAFGSKPNTHFSNKPPSSPSRSSSLFVVTNPPFGNRISADNIKNKDKSNVMLLPLYQTLSDRIRRCRPRCSSFAVLTNNPNLVARTGLKDCLEILRVSHGGRPAYVMQSTNQNSTST